MDVVLNVPVAPAPAVAPPSVAQVQLLSADYSFTNVSVSIVWNELDASGTMLQSKAATMSPANTAIFFATPVAGLTTLHDVFQAAFLTAIEAYYGAGTLAPEIAPPPPPAAPILTPVPPAPPTTP